MRKNYADERDAELGVATDEFVPEWLTKPVYEELPNEHGELVMKSSGIHKDGKEYGDPIPMHPPVGYNEPPDLMTMMRQMLRSERYQLEMERAGLETEEEADDFDIDDDQLEPLTLYEKWFIDKTQPKAPQEPAGGPQSPPAASPAPDAKTPPSEAPSSGAGVASPPPSAPAGAPSTST